MNLYQINFVSNAYGRQKPRFLSSSATCTFDSDLTNARAVVAEYLTKWHNTGRQTYEPGSMTKGIVPGVNIFPVRARRANAIVGFVSIEPVGGAR